MNFNNANYTTLWNKAGFEREFGRSFDNSRDSVYAMNGDASYDFMVSGVNFYPRDERLVVAISGAHTGSFRVNYIVVPGWHSVSRMKVASGRANIYGCNATLDVSYIPAIHSLVFETKGSGHMTTGTQTGYSAKALTLPSNYQPANERCVCPYANLQLKFGVALRVQTNGDVMFDVSSSEPMRGFGWPSAMGFIPL